MTHENFEQFLSKIRSILLADMMVFPSIQIADWNFELTNNPKIKFHDSKTCHVFRHNELNPLKAILNHLRENYPQIPDEKIVSEMAGDFLVIHSVSKG